VSFEALARWTHPEQGPIPPDVFIPLAEDLGLIDTITNQLLKQACRDATTWRDSITLSFNFSATQLREGSFPLSLMAILGQTGLPPHRLEVEVTESALIHDLSAARKTLSDLRAAGIHIVMDDFGKGFSSLYHLRELRFDKLKIDASFVKDITEDNNDIAIIRAIAGMSQGLGLIVTAEGIESCHQVRALMENGIQRGQGYIFGQPMPVGEARRLISATGQAQNVA
jgi:EAL domain-containing protein (putative c-di-GMP-specific phosphodiesterase class I)